jgi:holin-like protein
MVILQCAIIFAFLALGELVVWLTDIPIPSSIIGMLLLTAALQFKIVKLHQVSGVADFLVKNLGFFFIPAGVAMISYFDVLRAQWFPIVVASAVSTVVVFAVTGQMHQLVRKYFTRNSTKNNAVK